jgi:hypothetical protein
MPKLPNLELRLDIDHDALLDDLQAVVRAHVRDGVRLQSTPSAPPTSEPPRAVGEAQVGGIYGQDDDDPDTAGGPHDAQAEVDLDFILAEGAASLRRRLELLEHRTDDAALAMTIRRVLEERDLEERIATLGQIARAANKDAREAIRLARATEERLAGLSGKVAVMDERLAHLELAASTKGIPR